MHGLEASVHGDRHGDGKSNVTVLETDDDAVQEIKRQEKRARIRGGSITCMDLAKQWSYYQHN